jgi:hypothetical protein
MLKSKSALFISLLFAAQLASAGGVILEKQATPPFDQSLNGTVILECQPDNGSVILENGIIVQDKLAGAVILENTPDTHDEGGVIIERGGIKLLSGGVILERGIIVQKDQLAGGVILENTSRPDAGVVVHDGKLAGTVIIERGGIIMEDLHLAGGLIIDRHGRANGQSLSA